MDLGEIKQIVKLASSESEEIKSIIRLAISAIDEYIPELEQPIIRLRNYIVDSHVEIINRLMSRGFSEDQSIAIAGNIISAMNRKK